MSIPYYSISQSGYPYHEHFSQLPIDKEKWLGLGMDTCMPLRFLVISCSRMIFVALLYIHLYLGLKGSPKG